jgi:hypothetical protein
MQITLIWALHPTVGFEATTVQIGGSVRFAEIERWAVRHAGRADRKAGQVTPRDRPAS